MPDHRYNVATRTLVAIVLALAALAVVDLGRTLPALSETGTTAVAVFLPLALLWSFLTFKVARAGGGRIALALAPAAYQALVPFHPPAALAVAAVVPLVDWLGHRRRPTIGLFNLGQILLSVWAASKAVVLLPDIGHGPMANSLGALVAAGTCSVVGMTSLLAVIRLATGRGPAESGLFAWSTLASETITACFAALLALTWTVTPWLILVPAVPLTLVFTILSRLEARESALREEVGERKRAELELRYAKDAAEAANRAKGEFLTRTSHELRTPMNAILGSLQLLSERQSTLEEQELIDTARNSSDALLILIDSILDLARLESGQLKLERVPLAPRAVVEEMIQLHGAAARAKGLRIAQDVAPDCPSRVVADPRRLRQVLFSLVSNAIKFTDAGEVEILVAPAVGPDEGRLRFAVRDTGIGIEPHKRDEIFEAFTQGERYLTRQRGGVGIGLTIAARLVRLWGGTLEVQSEPGRGSTFTFSLPFEAPSIPAPRSQEPAPTDTAATRLRLLLAEDNPVNRKLAVRILERAGYEVVCAEDGEKAVARWREGDIDLVLMDVQMPNLDGLEATRRIRAEESLTGTHVPIVAVTAHVSEEDRAECERAGMDGFVPKPVDPSRLAAEIEAALT